MVMWPSNRLIALMATVMTSLSLNCSSNFDPPSLLNDLRILALVAEPVQAGPKERVTLTPKIYIPAGETLASQRVSFCPLSLGAQGSYVCAVPDCETTLGVRPDGMVIAEPYQWVADCFLKLAESGSLPKGIPAVIPEQLEVLYRYQVELTNGQQRQGVFRQQLWTQTKPFLLNTNPLFTDVTIAGQKLSAGQAAAPVRSEEEVQIQVRVDPLSLDSYLDPTGEERREDAILAFFTTAGRFPYDQSAGIDIEVKWKAEKLDLGQDRATLYFVVRDLRGGQAVTGPYFIPIVQ
jgi:hypothetical protein